MSGDTKLVIIVFVGFFSIAIGAILLESKFSDPTVFSSINDGRGGGFKIAKDGKLIPYRWSP